MDDFCVEEILEFIERRWSDTQAHWFDGNCFWFAKILCERFSILRIYYLPAAGHFVAGKNDIYFDASGLVDPDEQPESLDWIKKEDDTYYNRLMRDCAL